MNDVELTRNCSISYTSAETLMGALWPHDGLPQKGNRAGSWRFSGLERKDVPSIGKPFSLGSQA